MAKKGAVEGEDTDMGDPQEVSGVSRVYELGFHLDPELPTEEAKQAYQSIRSLIEGTGGIVAEGEPEKVALAYTISRQEVGGRRDFDSAYFAWIAYESFVEAHAEIVSAAGSEKRIIRFIDLVTDKEIARHAAEREALAAKVPERGNESEVVSDDAALDAALESATT